MPCTQVMLYMAWTAAILQIFRLSCWKQLCVLAGDGHGFSLCMALYAFSNACIGANLVAYATDVMPTNLGGFGLGLYRCAGDLGKQSIA